MGVDDRRILWLFTGTALALGVLIVLAGLRPSAVNWGVHSLGFLSPAGRAIVCCLLGLALLPPVQLSVINTIGRGSRIWTAWSPARRRTLVAFLLCATAVLFWLVRQRTHLLGDGYLVVRSLGIVGRPGDIPGSFPTAPLSALLSWSILQLLNVFDVGQAAVKAWQLASIASGLVAVIALWHLAGMLWHDAVERVAGFVLLCAAGGSQLLCGYVETYPAVYALLWVYLVAALRTLRGEMHAAVPAVLYVILGLFHFGMSILAPSLVYVLFRAVRRDGWRTLLWALLPSLLAGCLVLWVMGYGPARILATALRDGAHYVPIAGPNGWSDAYTLFSVWHIADLMNLFLLLAPFSLVMLGTFFVSFGLSGNARPKESGLWYAVGIPAALWLFVNSFELGLSRDWDLAASFGMMVVAGALVVWHHVTGAGITRQRVMVLMALFTLALTGGWISINADAAYALNRFQVLQDARLWAGSARADAQEELGIYYRETGDVVSGAESFARSVALDSTNARRWIQLAGALVTLHDDAPALRAYERALALNTSDPEAYLNAGILLHRIGRTAAAIENLRKSLAMDSASARSALALGTLLMLAGTDDEEALTLLERAERIDPSLEDARARAALCRRRIGMAISARKREGAEN